MSRNFQFFNILLGHNFVKITMKKKIAPLSQLIISSWIAFYFLFVITSGCSSENKIVTATLPKLAPGTTWKYIQTDSISGKSFEYIQKVKNVTSSRVDMEYVSDSKPELNQNMILTPEMNMLHSDKATLSSESKMLSFPVTVGKSWDYEYILTANNARVRILNKISVKVISYEKVNVPGGQFDAFKIVGSGLLTDEISDKKRAVLTTYWYAPEVMNIVRYEYSDGTNTNVRELVQYIKMGQ